MHPKFQPYGFEKGTSYSDGSWNDPRAKTIKLWEFRHLLNIRPKGTLTGEQMTNEQLDKLEADTEDVMPSTKEVMNDWIRRRREILQHRRNMEVVMNVLNSTDAFGSPGEESARRMANFNSVARDDEVLRGLLNMDNFTLLEYSDNEAIRPLPRPNLPTSDYDSHSTGLLSYRKCYRSPNKTTGRFPVIRSYPEYYKKDENASERLGRLGNYLQTTTKSLSELRVMYLYVLDQADYWDETELEAQTIRFSTPSELQVPADPAPLLTALELQPTSLVTILKCPLDSWCARQFSNLVGLRGKPPQGRPHVRVTRQRTMLRAKVRSNNEALRIGKMPTGIKWKIGAEVFDTLEQEGWYDVIDLQVIVGWRKNQDLQRRSSLFVDNQPFTLIKQLVAYLNKTSEDPFFDAENNARKKGDKSYGILLPALRTEPQNVTSEDNDTDDAIDDWRSETTIQTEPKSHNEPLSNRKRKRSESEQEFDSDDGYYDSGDSLAP